MRILTRMKKTSSLKVNAAQKRTFGQTLASVTCGFLPIASYVMAHHEASNGNPALYSVVAACLIVSAPTLAKWSARFMEPWKGWAFTFVLETVMVFSHITWLNLTGLVLLCGVNALIGWEKMAQWERSKGKKR